MNKFMMFIDSNNFYKNAEELLNIKKPKFKWASLILGIRDQFCTECNDSYFIKAKYYTALSDRNDNPQKYDAQKRFIEAISKIQFVDVIIGYLMRKQKSPDIPIDANDPNTYYHIEKNTDVNLSNDVIENVLRGNINTVLFVAVDGDFEDTVRKVKEYGADAYLVLPLGAKGQKMKTTIGLDNIIYLDENFLRKYMLR